MESTMPLVHICLLKGKSREYIRAIADGIHEALVDAYNVPAADRFQLINQYERDNLIYDPDYLGIHRSDDIVFVHIFAGNWRDTARKQALYKAIADRLGANPGLRREDVHVVISSNERDEWSLGNGVASYIK
jgi:phenylpyruvate tautomerase PptA (4-oxalocrotonate tautomerase family)